MTCRAAALKIGAMTRRVLCLGFLCTFLAVGQAKAQMLTGYAPKEHQSPLTSSAPVQPVFTPVPIVPPTLPANPVKDGKQPVDFSADNLEHDEKAQTVTATGNVRLIQAGRALAADKVVYNLATDTATATGHVVLTDVNGDMHFAEKIEIGNELRSGFVSQLHSMMMDGGRFTAEKGERLSEKKIVMHNASYTPCNCETDRKQTPAWQIKAKEVTYDEETHRVSYKNARFEIFGVPLLFTPFLSHSDGKVKQKSGLLSPTAGYDSQLGAVMTNRYYWAIGKDRDATIGVMATSKEAPVLLTGYRQRFDHAEIRADGSLTRSGRTDSVAGQDVAKKDDWRGHLFADGKWDINDKWRAGTNLELASDDQYLRQYDFSGKNVLESQVYAERFSGRNYGAARALAFQDTRILENRTDQPNVLPEIETRFLGKPNEVLGGRWSLEASALGLQRFGGDQDMNRAVLTGGWQKRVITGFGLVSTLDVTARADAYSTRDRDLAASSTGISGSANRGRGTVRGHFLTSYPVVKAMEKMQAVIEPIVALTVSPNIGERFDSIPNEDSQDIQVDTSNLFEPDRFPGYDRIEDRSRITYGVRNGLYGYGGSSLDTFLGQSYRFSAKDNPFPDGSGLEDQASDIVGRVAGVYDKNYGLGYAFQLGQDNMSARRHEIDSYANFNRIQLGGRYLFTKTLEGTSIDETREQMGLSAGYRLTDHWRMRTGSLHDLGGSDPGLRKASVGFDYVGCCVSFSTTANRNLTSDSSGDSGTEITFRFGLKNIGEFEGPSIDLSGLSSATKDDTTDGADAPPLP